MSLPYEVTKEEDIRDSDFGADTFQKQNLDTSGSDSSDSDAEPTTMAREKVEKDKNEPKEDGTSSDENDHSNEEKAKEEVNEHLMSIREDIDEASIDEYKKELKNKPNSLEKQKKIPKFKDTIRQRFKIWCCVGESLKCVSCLFLSTICGISGIFICPILWTFIFLLVMIISFILSLVLLCVSPCCIIFLPFLVISSFGFLSSPLLLIFGVICIPCSGILGFCPLLIPNAAFVVFLQKDDDV